MIEINAYVLYRWFLTGRVTIKRVYTKNEKKVFFELKFTNVKFDRKNKGGKFKKKKLSRLLGIRILV